MICLISNLCLQRTPVLEATTLSPLLILCPSKLVKSLQWAMWQGGILPKSPLSLKYLQLQYLEALQRKEKESTTSRIGMCSISQICFNSSPIAQVEYSGLAIPAFTISRMVLGLGSLSVRRYLYRRSLSERVLFIQSCSTSLEQVFLLSSQRLGTGSYSSPTDVPVISTTPQAQGLGSFKSFIKCSFVDLKESSHFTACSAITYKLLYIFQGLAFLSRVQSVTSGTEMISQLFLKAYIVRQERIIDFPLPVSPPRNTLLKEGVEQQNLQKQGTCPQSLMTGLVGRVLNLFKKSKLLGFISMASTALMA